MKILNFGSCNIDYVYHVPHIVVPGETITVTSLEKYPGGKGLNTSVAIAKSGGDVYHAGLIGKDGEFLREILKSSGANTDYLNTIDTPTGQALVQIDSKGESSIIVNGGANVEITTDYIDYVLSNFDKEDCIILQNETNNLDYIINKASQKGMKIFFNPSPFTKELKNINYDLIYLVILNKGEGYNLTGYRESEKIVGYFKKKNKNLKVVLTLGSKGCVYSDIKNSIYCSAYDVDTVDSTGAGDTFTGYFISEHIKKKDILKTLKYASAAAAIAVSKNGAASSIPSAKEVKEILPSLTPIFSKKDFETDQKITMIYSYINDNVLTANLTDLSSILGYTESHTSFWIKSNMNTTFSELVIGARCAYVARLLTTTDMPIGDIISLTGYENESFLRKKFFEIYHKSLREYRKSAQTRSDE